MKLAITICSTEKYAYALTAQARRVQSACSFIEKGHIIIVGDGSAKLREAADLYRELMPNWEIVSISEHTLKDDHLNYKEAAQLLIGQLRTAAFSTARKLNVDYCWSLDSDVLPAENSLNCMLQMLDFDGGYYSISTCPYPSQGGGGFLGGRGTRQHPIALDYYEDEREIPEEVGSKLKTLRESLTALGRPKTQEDFQKIESVHKELRELDEKIKEFPIKGNVFALNAINWRKRGWLEHAYPGIGKGSVVPTDWCGFGCTLMNKKALNLAHFDGYDGRGTEDLYIVWHRWFQAELKLNVITHCLCDHVIRNPGKPGYYILQQTYHETEGEFVGHPRFIPRPFYSFDLGECYDANNDGKITFPAPATSKSESDPC